ncbi:hypothetical protein LZ31DRAFT_575036 [Colletotrichum somersetense]|nr:hypothetical protein LZ31DRAFT_575036 [Colletotrichum somersetense]
MNMPLPGVPGFPYLQQSRRKEASKTRKDVGRAWGGRSFLPVIKAGLHTSTINIIIIIIIIIATPSRQSHHPRPRILFSSLADPHLTIDRLPLLNAKSAAQPFAASCCIPGDEAFNGRADVGDRIGLPKLSKEEASSKLATLLRT